MLYAMLMLFMVVGIAFIIVGLTGDTGRKGNWRHVI